MGGGPEARELRSHFAGHVEVPRVLRLNSQRHKQIVQENIVPEPNVIKESWVNPSLMERVDEQQVFTTFISPRQEETLPVFKSEFEVGTQSHINLKSFIK